MTKPPLFSNNKHNPMRPIKLATALLGSLLSVALIAPAQAGMADDPVLGKFMLDKLETTDADGSSPLNWELDAWLGQDLNKLWLKSTGERIDGSAEQSNELLFSRAVSPFWDIQIGWQQDKADGETRDYISMGAQGLAPYLFDTSVSLLIGENDQVGLAAQFEYELMLTQRWELSPEIEVDIWSQDDDAIGVGSGLSQIELGLRLSYAFWREFAPYIGVSWSKSFGNTAEFAQAEGEGSESTQYVAGVRLWF